MARFEVVGTGFTVLDRIYVDESTRPLEELGGSCGNVLISLAILGRVVAPVLCLGDDAVGRLLLDEFDRAGASTDFIDLREGYSSPIVAELLDTASGRHTFRTVCPETGKRLAGFKPIGMLDVASARAAISCCSIFFADRISEAIVEAMAIAAAGGAVVYFEPSAAGDPELFAEAVQLASIVKFSSERLGDLVASLEQSADKIFVVTHGEAGLEVRRGAERIICPAIAATRVVDTCGSGDMVSVGLIDRLLKSRGAADVPLALSEVLAGVIAGQALATENCAFIGARGVFRQLGAEHVRDILLPNLST